jgi:protein-disulfide isomerase
MTEARLSVPVSDKDHSEGPLDAKITLVEYGDYECPYCGQAFPIVEKIRSTFGDSLRFVFRNLPIAEAHPHAEQAAEMAEAVGLQGDDKFWAIHNMLYENQHALGEDALYGYAKDVGADVDKVRKDIAEGAPRRRVEADFESAIRSGANGTPTFFINGDRYDGSWNYEPFETYLHEVLRGL